MIDPYIDTLHVTITCVQEEITGFEAIQLVFVLLLLFFHLKQYIHRHRVQAASYPSPKSLCYFVM